MIFPMETRYHTKKSFHDQAMTEMFYYSSDSTRGNIARGKKANKQISLADQGLTRSFHWSMAISKTSFF